LCGDDLVGVDVVAHDVNGAGKNTLHGRNVPRGGRIFNQISAERKGFNLAAGGGISIIRPCSTLN
jgi:hypothetical protein